MATTRVPAIDGWFTLDEDAPALIGTRCTTTGTYFFPPDRSGSRAPGAAGGPVEDVQLSRQGRVWSYTDAGYQPPAPFVAPTDPYEPFCIAAVELDFEQIVVMGQMVRGTTVADLRVGLEVEVVLETLYSDDEHDYVVWKWRPVEGVEGNGADHGGTSVEARP